MDVLVINRSVDTQRMAFQALQLKSLKLSYQRIDAVTPETLVPHSHDAYWKRWNRCLTQVEKAIFASHQLAWETISRGIKPKLIIEDDACLSTEVPGFLDKAVDLSGLDRITLEYRGRKKLVSASVDSRIPMRRLYQDRTGAAAYILWPSGAKKLLTRSAQYPGLADSLLCEAYELVTFQADPALAVQLDTYQRYVGPSPTETKSIRISITSSQSESFSILQEFRYRSRRVRSELRMGVQFLKYRGASVRKHICLSDDWPFLGQ